MKGPRTRFNQNAASRLQDIRGELAKEPDQIDIARIERKVQKINEDKKTTEEQRTEAQRLLQQARGTPPSDSLEQYNQHFDQIHRRKFGKPEPSAESNTTPPENNPFTQKRKASANNPFTQERKAQTPTNPFAPNSAQGDSRRRTEPAIPTQTHQKPKSRKVSLPFNFSNLFASHHKTQSTHEASQEPKKPTKAEKTQAEETIHTFTVTHGIKQYAHLFDTETKKMIWNGQPIEVDYDASHAPEKLENQYVTVLVTDTDQKGHPTKVTYLSDRHITDQYLYASHLMMINKESGIRHYQHAAENAQKLSEGKKKQAIDPQLINKEPLISPRMPFGFTTLFNQQGNQPPIVKLEETMFYCPKNAFDIFHKHCYRRLQNMRLNKIRVCIWLALSISTIIPLFVLSWSNVILLASTTMMASYALTQAYLCLLGTTYFNPYPEKHHCKMQSVQALYPEEKYVNIDTLAKKIHMNPTDLRRLNPHCRSTLKENDDLLIPCSPKALHSKDKTPTNRFIAATGLMSLAALLINTDINDQLITLFSAQPIAALIASLISLTFLFLYNTDHFKYFLKHTCQNKEISIDFNQIQNDYTYTEMLHNGYFTHIHHPLRTHCYHALSRIAHYFEDNKQNSGDENQKPAAQPANNQVPLSELWHTQCKKSFSYDQKRAIYDTTKQAIAEQESSQSSLPG